MISRQLWLLEQAQNDDDLVVADVASRDSFLLRYPICTATDSPHAIICTAKPSSPNLSDLAGSPDDFCVQQAVHNDVATTGCKWPHPIFEAQRYIEMTSHCTREKRLSFPDTAEIEPCNQQCTADKPCDYFARQK